MTNRVLIVGATGMIGRNFSEHACQVEGIEPVGISRRKPDWAGDLDWVPVDLLDRDSAISALRGYSDISDILYAGYVHGSGWQSETEANTALLANTLDAVEEAGAKLKRVVLMQGQKYYGSHLGPFKTPSREDDERHVPPNFYYDQQDLLEERGKDASWAWTALRPHVVCGIGSGSPLNIVSVLACYAVLMKELGLPLKFPGSPGCYSAVYQATDAKLLSRAIEWALEAEGAANQAFNITNGDFFRWENFWPRLAEHFNMSVGRIQDISLEKVMADKEPLWQEIVARYNLTQSSLSEMVNWAFGDYVFHTGWDVMASTIKVRQAGFQDCLDSEEMFLAILKEMQDRKIIPRY